MKLRPLQIKKMLDDDHDTDDLDVDMTAADVFVDRGLAQIDARDQRGTLRVIQKPTPYSPARFPSVTLDWDAAAEDYERRILDKREAAATSVHKFPTIIEEDSQAGSVSGSQDDDHQRTPTPTGNITPTHQTDDFERRRDMPVLSVEKEHEIPGSPARWDEQPHVQEQDSQDNNEKTIEATPQHRRFESQELGGSPTPTRPSALLSKKTAAMSQPRAPVSRGRAANRTINRIASESKSPLPGKGQYLTEQMVAPLRHKTRSLTRRRISQLMKPVEDDENQGETNEQDNERREEEGGEDGHFDYDGDVAMDDGRIAPDTFTSAREVVPEQDLPNDNAPESRVTRLGKRKKSQEDLQSNKEPRLNRASTPTQETLEPRGSSPSAMRTSEQASSFSGPRRRPSIAEQHSPPRRGLGLGITKSPPRKQPTKHDSKSLNNASKLAFVDSAKKREQPSSQASITAAPVSFSSARKSLTQNDSTPAKPQTPADKVKSALRKEASADKRRSVSFSEKNSVFPVTDDSQSRPPSGPGTKDPEKAKEKRAKSPKDKAWDKPSTSSVTVYPGGVTAEKLQQIFEEQQREAEKKKQEQEEMNREMREAEERNASSEYLELLADIQRTRAFISENKDSGRQKTQKQVTSYRAKLDAQLLELEYLKTNPNSHSKTPEKKKKKKRASQAAAEEKGEETNTPSSTSKESGSAEKTKAARRESSSKRSTKSPHKQTESEEVVPIDMKTNGDSAQTTDEVEASQESETAHVETPLQPKRKTTSASKAQNTEPITASPRRTSRSHRSLRAVDGADAMDIDQPSQPQREPGIQQEKEQQLESEQQVNGQYMEMEQGAGPEQEGKREQEQPQEPEPVLEPQPQDREEENGYEDGEEQEQGQEQEQTEAREPEREFGPESEPEPGPEPEQHEPEIEPESEQEPAQEREREQEQQAEPEPEPEAVQEAELKLKQQPQGPEELEEQPQEQPVEQLEEQPQEPEMVPETSQPQPQEPQEPWQAEPGQPEQQSPQKPQSQQSRLLSQEQSQSFPMSDDVNLPEMETIRTLDQSKKPKEQSTPQPTPQPTTEEPKPASLEQGEDKESSGDDDETDSETGTDSDSDSDSGSDDEEQGPELTKADLLRRANGANGTSSARNSMAKSPAPSQQQLPQSQPLPQNRYFSPRGSSQPPAQSQPQPHIQPFQSVNKLSSARASLQGLRNVITAQKQNYDAQLQEARMATVTRKKDVFDPPSDSESEDDSESESDSDSDSDSDDESDADNGDIHSTGTVGKLRKALQKK